MNESPQSTQSSVLSSEQKISTAQDLAQLVDQIAILLQDADQVDKREYEALYAAFYRNKNKVESSLDAEGKELVLLQEARLNDLNQQFRKIERERNEVLTRWKELKSIHRVVRKRLDKRSGKTSEEMVYYISSSTESSLL